MKDCLVSTIQKIETAFAAVPPPAGWKGIYTAEAWDDYRDPTPEERAKDFKMLWQMATGEDLNQCQTALSHLKPDGWHYFIPAYMRWTLQYQNDPKWRNSNAMDSASFSLRDKNSKNGSYDLSGYIEDRHSRLNLTQIEAVMAFLQCLRQEEADFYADELLTDLPYWFSRYKNKGGSLTKEEVLWLL